MPRLRSTYASISSRVSKDILGRTENIGRISAQRPYAAPEASVHVLGLALDASPIALLPVLMAAGSVRRRRRRRRPQSASEARAPDGRCSPRRVKDQANAHPEEAGLETRGADQLGVFERGDLAPRVIEDSFQAAHQFIGGRLSADNVSLSLASQISTTSPAITSTQSPL